METEGRRSLGELRVQYGKDRFAAHAGCVILEAEPDRVVCEMRITDAVKNAYGGVMGGAIFTLADFAFAVACNYGGVPSVAVECNIRFYAATKGTALTAVCRPDRDGRTLGHYTVEITDDLGAKIAGFTAIAFHKHGAEK